MHSVFTVRFFKCILLVRKDGWKKKIVRLHRRKKKNFRTAQCTPSRLNLITHNRSGLPAETVLGAPFIPNVTRPIATRFFPTKIKDNWSKSVRETAEMEMIFRFKKKNERHFYSIRNFNLGTRFFFFSYHFSIVKSVFFIRTNIRAGSRSTRS